MLCTFCLFMFGISTKYSQVECLKNPKQIERAVEEIEGSPYSVFSLWVISKTTVCKAHDIRSRKRYSAGACLLLLL